DKIDELINRQYINITDTTELGQLSRLFRIEFIQDLMTIIKPNPTNQPGYKQLLEVSLCWIDKRPLADFKGQNVSDHNNNKITEKVEVADAAFFFFEEHGHIENNQEKIT